MPPRTPPAISRTHAQQRPHSLRWSSATALLVAVMLVLFGLQPAPASAANTGTVTGLVTLDGVTDPPDGTVELYRWGGTSFALVGTRNLGPAPDDEYSFGSLAAGTYYVVVHPADVDTYRDTYSVSPSIRNRPTTQTGAGTFTLADGGTVTQDIVVQQWGTSSASGKITSSAGPVSGATVTLFRLIGTPGAFTSAEPVDNDTTTGSGDYTFPTITNNGWYYTVGAYMYDPSAIIYLGGGTNPLTASYWAHTQASPNKNIVLPMRTISGLVTGGNRTIPDTTVIAYAWDPASHNWSYALSSGLDATGRYAMTLPAGDYSLQVVWTDNGNNQDIYLNGTDLPPLDNTSPGVVTLSTTNVTRDIALVSLLAAPDVITEPVLSGTGVSGTQLSVTNGTWTLSPTGYDYIWYRWGTVIDTPNAPTYTVTNADAGLPISVEVRTKLAGHRTGAVVSNEVVAIGLLTKSSDPTISGSGLEGSSLTVNPGTWSNGATTSIEWLRDGVAIAGATATSYVVTTDDVGHEISARVTATKLGFQSATADSNVIMGLGVITPTTAPSVTGALTVGSTLTLNPGVWPNTPTLTRQWLRNGVAIAGATSLTYVLTVADAGALISARVSASAPNASGSATTTGQRVAKLTSKTVGKLSTKKISHTKRVKYSVKVTVPGVAGPTGVVKVYDKAKLIKTVTLTAGARGAFSFKLKKLKKGKHKIRAVYAGTAQI
ncbi:MAG: Ig-like domain repeat protein, partial [Nocardioides sp.]